MAKIRMGRDSTFHAELVVAGLAGLPFSWGPDGVYDTSLLTEDQKKVLEKVVAAHDSTKVLEDPIDKRTEALNNAKTLEAVKEIMLEDLQKEKENA